MEFNFVNKNILITGASRGLGANLVEKYINYGSKVISVSRSKTLVSKSKNFFNINIDLQKKNSPNLLYKLLKKKNILPDIIINNLGGDLNLKEPLINYNLFEKVMRLNFGTAVQLTNLFAPIMKKKKWGRICFISSISGLENQGTPAYCSAKAAINAYVRSIGRLLIKDNIIVTNVLPGAFYTKNGYWDFVKKKKKVQYKNFLKRISSGRLGSVEDISNIVIFMTSNYTSFCAGTSFLVDGGQGKILDNYS
jgi:3-oxoacyl-[acyl-carrier protein] reductase